MARKPAALRKGEDIEKVPSNQEVTIDVSPEVEKDDPVLELEQDIPEPIKPVAKDPPAKEAEKPTIPDEVIGLRQQIEDLKRAQEVNQAEFKRQLEESNRNSALNNQRMELENIETSIREKETELRAASTERRNALDRGDFDTEEKANLRVSEASAELAYLRAGKVNLEAYIAQETGKAPEKPVAPAADPLETHIAALPEPAKQWLRSHPEYMRDARKNARIQAAHWDVLDAGHSEYTPAYFEALEVRLGLKQAQDNDEPAPETRSRTVSAPVTRDVPSPTTGKTQSNRITLTAEEREIARSSMPGTPPGEAERIYAQNKLKLQQLKADGHYREN